MNYLSKLGQVNLRMPLLLLASIFCLVTALQLTSCNKLNESGTARPMDNDTNPAAVSDRETVSPTPQLDKQAYNDLVNAAYETDGRTVFEHFAYFQGVYTPFDYYPASMHAHLQTQLTELNNIQISSSMPEAITDVTSLIQNASATAAKKTKAMQRVQALEQHYNGLIAQVDAGTFNSFGNIWFYLKNQEQTILADPNLTKDVKNLLVSYNSIMRNYLKYEFGKGGFEPPTTLGIFDACFLGRKLKCWLKFGLSNFIKIGFYAKQILDELEEDEPDMSKVSSYALLILSEFSTAADKMTDSECQCSDGPTLDDIIPCKTPTFIGVSLAGCGLTQKLITGDYGGYTGTFTWTLTGCTVPTVGNEGNIVTIAVNSSQTVVVTVGPWVVVTQNSPSDAVIVTVGITCSPTTGLLQITSAFNLHALTNGAGAGTITVSKWSNPQTTGDHVVNINTQHDYYTYGTALALAAAGTNAISFETSIHGEIIPTSTLGLGEVRVWWKQYTVPQFGYEAKLTAKVNGQCAISVPNQDDINVAIQL